MMRIIARPFQVTLTRPVFKISKKLALQTPSQKPRATNRFGLYNQSMTRSNIPMACVENSGTKTGQNISQEASYVHGPRWPKIPNHPLNNSYSLHGLPTADDQRQTAFAGLALGCSLGFCLRFAASPFPTLQDHLHLFTVCIESPKWRIPLLEKHKEHFNGNGELSWGWKCKVQ